MICMYCNITGKQYDKYPKYNQKPEQVIALGGGGGYTNNCELKKEKTRQKINFAAQTKLTEIQNESNL